MAQSSLETSQVLAFNAAGLGMGVFLLAASTVSPRSRAVLPRWLVAIAAIDVIALMTPLSRAVFGPSIPLLAVISMGLPEGN